MIEAVIFDLDGTLINTLDDIHDVVNLVLVSEGHGTRTMNQVRLAVGRGVEHLVRTLLPEAPDDGNRVNELSDLIRSTYITRGDEKTRPYEGIPELLEELDSMGLPLAVLTNKPQASADYCIERYFPHIDFRIVTGAEPGTPGKPSPAVVVPVMEVLRSAPERTLMVGDSDVDMNTATNFNLIPVGVSWGFRDVKMLRDHGAEHIIHDPSELLELITSSRT